MRPLLLLPLALLLPAIAVAASLPAPLARGIAHLDALKGFSCDFEQTLSYADGSQRHYTGRLDVRRPGRFRWQYREPYAQLYVSDGNGIWHYEPDLMQAEHMQSLDAVDPTAMRLLDGRIHAAQVRLLADESGVHASVYRYKVRLGKGPELWMGMHADGALVYIESVDALGNHNRISLRRFSAIAPPAEVFRFTPPAGVDIVTDAQSPSGRGE